MLLNCPQTCILLVKKMIPKCELRIVDRDFRQLTSNVEALSGHNGDVATNPKYHSFEINSLSRLSPTSLTAKLFNCYFHPFEVVPC